MPSPEVHAVPSFVLAPLLPRGDETSLHATPSPIATAPDLPMQPPSPPRSIELRLSPDLGVHLSRSEQGLVVVVEAAPLRTGPAEAELPRIVGALRARGLSVSRAGVRTASGRSGAGARAR